MGGTYLEDMTRGQNAKYTSEHFMQEGIQALAEVVSTGLTIFALCVNETSDVTITKQLIVYCRYIVDGGGQNKLLVYC